MFLGRAARFGGVGDDGQPLSGEFESIAGEFDVADERVVQCLAGRAVEADVVPCPAGREFRASRGEVTDEAVQGPVVRAAPCFGAEGGCQVISDGVPFEEEVPGARVQEHEPGEVQRQGAGAEDARVEGEAETVGGHYSEWRAMQDFNKEGLARSIGVSNFHPDRLVDLIDHNEIVPAVNQIETHPFHQRAADQALMRERGVQIESWGPFAEGRNNLFTDPVLSAIAEAHGKSIAQVVLRWLIQRGVVVIPKSVRPERMAQNLDVFGFALTEEQMTRIAALDTGASLFFDHRDPAMVSWLGGRRMN